MEHVSREEGTATTTYQALLLHSGNPESRRIAWVREVIVCPCMYDTGGLWRTVRVWQRLCGQQRRKEGDGSGPGMEGIHG